MVVAAQVMNSQQKVFSQQPAISDAEFDQISRLIYQAAGITMASGKKTLVSSRLMRRLKHYGFDSFSQYISLITTPGNNDEFREMVDLLTTNETYFFREEKHFEFMRTRVLPQYKNKSIRVWSAACSRGAEPYSLGMLMQSERTLPWEMLATDICSKVLNEAREGLYPLAASERIPLDYLTQYCLKGVRSQDGVFMINDVIKNKIRFMQMNLNGDRWSDEGMFDVIFLRNVMIYFDKETKDRLVRRIVSRLNPGGYFIIGHSESITGIDHGLKLVQPSVYHKE